MNIFRRSYEEIRSKKRIFNIYFSKFARDIGILEWTSEYTKYILLGRSRVGSNFLRGLLNSHDGIIAFGEIFGYQDEIFWDVPGYNHIFKLKPDIRNDPIKFLERDVFRKFPPHIKAIGFKIFYYHAQDDKWKSVWDYLQTQKEIKVIHIIRKNILKTHLSRKRAVLSNTWTKLTNTYENQDPIYLPYEECLEVFINTRQWEAEHMLIFKDHPYINIYYEELSNKFKTEMQRIQGFLEVNYEDVEPKTYKQSTQPLSELISNYFDLKEKFTGSQWEIFFYN